MNKLFKELLILENRKINIPFKYCSRLFSKYQVPINKGFCEIRADNALIVL